MTRDNIRRELRKFAISEYLLEKIIDWIIEHSEQIAEQDREKNENRMLLR